MGETGRLISTRVKEHIRHTKNNDTNISAVAIHSTETKHSIQFDETKVLASASNYFERKILESIEIRKHKHNFNRDSGFELSNTWKPVIQKLNSQCDMESSITASGTSPEHSSTREGRRVQEPSSSPQPLTQTRLYKLRRRPHVFS